MLLFHSWVLVSCFAAKQAKCSRGQRILQLVSYSSLQVRYIEWNKILQRILAFLKDIYSADSFKVCFSLRSKEHSYLSNSQAFYKPKDQGRQLNVKDTL